MQIPILIKPVRIISGRLGSPIGPTGWMGPIGEEAAAGLDGLVGFTGRTGLSGMAGSHGMDSTVTGPRGRLGPAGDVGATGPKGPTGGAIIPGPNIAFFENIPGVAGVGAGGGAYAGSRFIYQMKNGDRYMPVIVTGLLECVAGVTTIQIWTGPPPAPGPGAAFAPASYVDLPQTYVIPNTASIPFVLMSKLYYGSAVEFWFDIKVSNSVGNTATVKNISALLVET